VDKSFTINIFGQKYSFRTDKDKDYVLEIAKYVNKKMEEAASNAKTVTTLNIAILAAMNIADDYFKIRLEKEELIKEIHNRSKEIIDKIDGFI